VEDGHRHDRVGGVQPAGLRHRCVHRSSQPAMRAPFTAGNIIAVGTTDGALEGYTASGGIDSWIAALTPAGTYAWTNRFFQFGTAGACAPLAARRLLRSK
jgi:hypothetical protein